MATDRSATSFDGLLNLNKPAGITSAKALYQVRSLTGVRKSGHAGTLDPAADGVLLLCMGRATKRVEALMNLKKRYRARGRLDITSESLDSDSPWKPVEVSRIPPSAEIEAAAWGLLGAIQQIPPAISALKIRGTPAYELVRRGRPVDLQPRTVHVYALEIHRYAWPDIEFDVVCGRGTYVRALIRDLGAAVGAGGCLTALTRTAVGPFRIEDACCFEDLRAGQFEARRIDLADLDAMI